MNPLDRRVTGLECKGELLNRVLGGIASSVDLRAFEVHLEDCESCRLSRLLSSDFEKIGAEQDDSARIARIAATALRQHRRTAAAHGSPPRRGRWLRWTWAALASTGVAAAATATGLIPWRAPRSEVPGAPPASDATAPAAATPSASTPAARGDALPAPPRAPEPPPDPPHGEPREIAPSVPAVTAQSLFRDANRARRDGARSTAIRLYRQLQRRFPSAPEANASRVSLGGALLEVGDTAAALEQFDGYLGARSTKSLAAEALYGRGRALRALGRGSEEKQTWQRLLESYPNSPYGDEARRRLQQLP